MDLKQDRFLTPQREPDIVIRVNANRNVPIVVSLWMIECIRESRANLLYTYDNEYFGKFASLCIIKDDGSIFYQHQKGSYEQRWSEVKVEDTGIEAGLVRTAVNEFLTKIIEDAILC